MYKCKSLENLSEKVFFFVDELRLLIQSTTAITFAMMKIINYSQKNSLKNIKRVNFEKENAHRKKITNSAFIAIFIMKKITTNDIFLTFAH